MASAKVNMNSISILRKTRIECAGPDCKQLLFFVQRKLSTGEVGRDARPMNEAESRAELIDAFSAKRGRGPKAG